MRSSRENLLWQFIILALAVFLIWRMSTMPGTTWMGYLVPVFIWIAAASILFYHGLRALVALLDYQTKRAVRKLFREMRAFYSCDHEYKITSLDRFPAAGHARYAEMTAKLRENGFLFVLDIEDCTNSRIYPKFPACQRFLRSANGTTVAEFSSVLIPKIKNVPVISGTWIRSLSLHTRFSDDTFLLTLFPSGMPKYDATCSQLLIEEMPWESGVEALVARHAERVAEWAKAHPAAAVVSALGPHDILKAMTALQRISNKIRQANGILSPAELRRMAADWGTKATADRLANLLEKVRAEEL